MSTVAVPEVLAPSPAELIRRVDDLPSLPAIYYRVRATLERPDSSLSEIEREIGTDAGMTSRLLCLANSSYYAVRGRLDSLGMALSTAIEIRSPRRRRFSALS